MRSGRTWIALLFCILHVTRVHSQSNAQVTLSEGRVYAGDSFKLVVNLDKASSCDRDIRVDFVGADQDNFIRVLGRVAAESSTTTVNVTVPKDLASGELKAQSVILFACPGYQKGKALSIPEIAITVVALPEKPPYPSRAQLMFTLTQKQFLDTKSAKLKDLIQNLDTKLERSSGESPQLRLYLIGLVAVADDELNATETQYRAQILNGKGVLPAFFADFHAQYKALLVDLKAPIPGAAKASFENSPTILFVQLKPHTSKNNNQEMHLSHTYPPDVTATRNAIRDNYLAYKYVKDSGRVTFDIQLSSTPVGARLYYRKLVDPDYQMFSKLTDIPKTELELAYWNFKFHKDGCSDEPVITVNPYVDTQPQVGVEFRHCARK